jgi:hypothetical protein
MRDGHGLVFRSFRLAIRVPIFLFRQRGRPTGELVEAFSAASSPRRPFAARRAEVGLSEYFPHAHWYRSASPENARA